jgi:hypothetical protein
MTDVLHIYAQPFQHQEAWVVGTREGLTILRDALTKALETEGPVSTVSSTNDGEGYHVLIWAMPEEKAQQLRTPYTDTEIVGPQTGPTPYTLLDAGEYRKLFGEP